MMTIYQSYAPVYDAIGQGQLSVRLADIGLRLCQHYQVQPATGLDLACGTGEAALHLARAGLQMTGVDRSLAMLTIAQGKSRDAQLPIRWLHAELDQVAQLCQTQQFDLITCFYDSLNYLLDADQLGQVLQAVAQVLAPGGLLLFDLNHERAFHYWHGKDRVIADTTDHMVFQRVQYDPQLRRGVARIVWFTRDVDQRWWRGEEQHTERVWSEAEVAAALDQVGLRCLQRLNEWGLPADHTTLRLLLVCGHNTQKWRD